MRQLKAQIRADERCSQHSFAPPVQVGSSPFAGGPSLVWYEGEQFTLIVLDSQAQEAGQCGCPVISYLA